jgi:hypothetical protein
MANLAYAKQLPQEIDFANAARVSYNIVIIKKVSYALLDDLSKAIALGKQA